MLGNANIPLVAACACVLALVALTLLAYASDGFQSLDTRLLARGLDHRAGETVRSASFFAHLADPLPLLAMLAAVCALALLRGRPLDAAGAVAIVAGANVTTQLLKVVLAHPRFQVVLGPHNLGAVAFPSGHATAAASIAIAFTLASPYWLRPLAALLGVGLYAAVGTSIVILGWHYPSDVVGGGLVASAWGFATVAALRVFDPARDYPERGASVSSRAAISTK